MKYTNILIDADDTIFDFHASEYQALKGAFEQCGLEFRDTFAEMYSKINDNLWKALERGEVTRKELHWLRFERLCTAIKISTQKDDVVRLNTAYVDSLSQQDIQLGNAFYVLERLSKICSVYVVTNGMSRVQRPRFKKSGLEKYVKDIFISEEMGMSKPSAEFFEQVLKTASISDKKTVLIVGDSLTSDMQGGRNSGIDTCLFDFRNKIDFPNSLCDYKITNLEELLNIIIGG